MLDSFKEFGKLTNRNALSVRNFYYAQTKILKQNDNLQKELGIDISKHFVQKFEHFDIASENKLKQQIDNLKLDGISTRSACLMLSNGDIKNMLRLQNKYQNLKAKQTSLAKKDNFEKLNKGNLASDAQVIKFPNVNQSGMQKQKLTDDEIKSLFLGLVKLVKQSADSDSQQKAQKFLQETEKDNRKKLIEIEQSKNEIERLKQVVLELQTKNDFLNKKLEDYRIEYVEHLNPNDRLFQ